MHKADWIEKIRHLIMPKIGIVTQWLEDTIGGKYYVESQTHNNQFVGRVPMGEESFEKRLHEMGFERNPLSTWKSLSSGEEMEGSWRKVGFDDHPHMQLHLIIYDGEKQQDAGDVGHTYVYAHWERRWDTHPIMHLRTKGFDAHEGVRRMKKILDESGIQHEPIRP